ncbi:msr9665 (plasmid) [Mesorhizobium japonicum MAFF 303099]|uniref:Msr9665 protein n=1 Tax=Mesorhizobium japonicum (strain LMG 29417 / CECT 9101 / MAFF 303099) TaxID=266835 RepID=Q98P02_RHILO|nr:msr9665 [Mesorhizobium japonicum MAFF 303099]
MFAMLETEPKRWLSRFGKSERRPFPAPPKLADMIFDPSTLPQRRHHALGKLDWFVAHP